MTESLNSLVVDSNFGFRLVVVGPHQSRYDALLRQWQSDGYAVVAPTLWQYEVTSALTKAVRFGPMTGKSAQDALALINSLGVQLVPPDEDQVRRAFEWTIRLGRAAAYDSFYLALAEQLQCEFWTADERLCNAANRPWVRWLDDPSAMQADPAQ
ncbi:MAG: type II toxin-antitoxin system VapC family toxin [Chloroflexota bacterium]